MELNRLTAHELIGLLNKGDISRIDICNSIIEAVEQKDKVLNAVVHFDKKRVLERAKSFKWQSKSDTLSGIPIFIKDNICVKDELTT